MKTMWKSVVVKLCVVLLIASLLVAVAACDTTPNTPADGPKPQDEYTLEKEPGTKQLTLYWQYSGDAEYCDMWLWWDGKDGSGYLLHPCEYGYKVVVNVPDSIEQVGFIVRRACSDPGGTSWGDATKDYDADRFAVLTGEETFVWLKSGDAKQYTSTDGGKTLSEIKTFSMAGIISKNQIRYTVAPACKLTSIEQVRLYDGENVIAIAELSSLNKNMTSGVLTTAEDLDITKAYELEVGDYGRKTVMPTDIFDTADFVANYTYDGDDLGATIRGNLTQFKVWAPTASKVVLNLFEDGDTLPAKATYEMQKQAQGIWSAEVGDCPSGTYYTYTVTTAMGTQEAVDPYARTAGVNGDRGMVIDLDSTDPQGFAQDTYVDTIDNYTDAAIWEVHVRDFSNKLAQSQYKGKYMAFTETGLTNTAGVPVGVDYLTNLGITHVHLLPVYDYATVDESGEGAQFNWGYDPKNYNVPEGSYSTDPYHGEVRVNEFKQMVQALHAQGLGVIMDVVYNHTHDANSSLNKIVPYYYYRYTSAGANSNGSGCGNETASERTMYSKFMIDSVCYWAQEYHVDGFRFDLMGLHDIDTMQKIEQAVHAINPKAMLYGEGWTGGTSALSTNKQAIQMNIAQITATEGAAGGIAVFNDAIRDGLKGSVFEKTSAGYISGNYSNENFNKVKFGLIGGSAFSANVAWRVKNAGVINYMSAHDNNTLWDKLALSSPNSTAQERLAMNRLGAAIVMVSQGTPFMQAGEEMLRSKQGNDNSYNAGDDINNLDWEALTPTSDEYAMMTYYRQLLAMRKAYSVFRGNGNVTVTVTQLASYAMQVELDDGEGNKALVLINPSSATMPVSIQGEWTLVGNAIAAGSEPLQADSIADSYTLGARDIAIMVQ